MIIDSHGHYTTAPDALHAYRGNQIGQMNKPVKGSLNISDEELVASVSGQLKFQTDRGTDVTLFSPRAGSMGHHFGGELISRYWSETCNDLVRRVCSLLPENFIGVCQLPQTPGVSPANCVEELERCINDLGMVACNLNPDPSGGYWTDPPMTDPYWFPIYEKLVELDVPAMVHVSSSCNPNFHFTGAHYINADTSVFMQLIEGDLFKEFPTLRLIIPHGGGAIPYHWGRYRGIAQDMGKPPLTEHLLKNVFFDTCVYHQPGIDLLFKVIPVENILFASEMIGAVRSVDQTTGRYFDDTKPYVDAVPGLSDADKKRVFEENVQRVYPRLGKALP